MPKRAVIRGPKDFIPEQGSQWSLSKAGSSKSILIGQVMSWGELWGSFWWTVDFSEVELEGSYRLTVQPTRFGPQQSTVLEVGPNLLWSKTWFYASIDQAERRQKLARNHVGWYDAGAEWQEADSHAAYLVGLLDIIEFAPSELSEADRERLEAQIVNGCDYLAILQDLAAELPNGHGAVVHQVWKFDRLILPGDVSKAALSWVRAAHLLSDRHSMKKDQYLSRARGALAWLKTAQPLGDIGLSRSVHGIPTGGQIPKEWMTRDLLMELWAEVELFGSGDSMRLEPCTKLAAQILKRQIPKSFAQGSLFGHFRTFDSLDVAEKAWTHSACDGVLGADMGGHFPNTILPLLLLADLAPTHEDAPQWRKAAEDFAYGYLLPACEANPFMILPLGYFDGEGLLWFAGLWHGMNAAYGLTAALAFEFYERFRDARFLSVATGNLQWIAGLNAGVTAESLFASHMFSRDIPPGLSLPCSMIQGFGTEQAGNWMQIRGSICNGFSVGDQFKYDIEPTVENDGPHAFTDEDWISHSGAWLSALARWTALRSSTGDPLTGSC
jgi:hypothetical protein